MKYSGYRLLDLRELQLLQLDAMKEIHSICNMNGIKYYMIGGTLLGAVRHKGFIPWDDDIDIAMLRQDYDKFVEVFSSQANQSKYFLQNYYTDCDIQPALSRVCIKGTILDLPFEYHLKNCKNTYVDIFPLDNVPDDDLMMTRQCEELSKIDKLFELKMARTYVNGFLSYKKILKRIIRFFLGVIPLRKLQNRRLQVMTKYKNENTQRVCSTVSKYGYMKQVMQKSIYGTPILYDFEDTKLYGPEHSDQYLLHLFGDNYMQVPPVGKRQETHDVYIKELK